MGRFDTLIPVVRSFLSDDLGSVPLPPAIEIKRRDLLERIDILSLGPTPSVPETILPPATSTVRRRPLDSVVRLFSASRKRYSLPASISYPPQVPENGEPPLPPKGSHSVRSGQLPPDLDYEIPKAVFSQTSDNVSLASSSHNQLALRRHPFSRLSLSPQLEIVQAHQEIAQVAPPLPTLARSPSPVPECRDDSDLTLPKRSLVIQSRRFSAFIDPAWTLAGALHHRHKPNKWTRLNLCLLAGGCRLIAYKSGHALNPSLVLFLCGATGLYAGRDSGMDHVIKIAHPSRGTTVLAADTEDQALVWIKQINLYAQGITPSETHSFLDHPTMLSTNLAPSHSSCSSSSSVPATPVRSILNSNPADLLNATLKQPGTEIQEDSGFSAPVSSGSEGNSGDGMVGIKAGQPGSEVLISQCLSSSTLLFSSRSANGDCIAGLGNQPSRSYQPLSDNSGLSNDIYAPPSTTIANTTVSARNTISNSFQSSVRREGFLSSMRRKVESLSSIRRTRKSLPQTSVCTSKLTMPKANSSADLHIPSTYAGVPVDQTALCRRFPSHATVATDRLGTGFDWAQLEGASRLFLNSDWSAIPSIASPKTRPHSFISISSHLAKNEANVSQIVGTSKHGPLINLHSSTNSSRVSVMPESNSRIIVSGEALIAIPGRISWTNRWCCLRSGFLDVYLSAGQPPGLPSTFSNSQRSSHTPVPSQSNDAWPVFSLTLQPGQVELGLAGDKHYKAALRLAVPKLSVVSLLFNAPDKLQMGTWIRGFIEALGIIAPENTQPPPELSVERTIASVKSSVSLSEVAEYDAPGSSYSNSSATLTSDCKTRANSGPRICELTEDEVSDLPSIDMRSAKLYDEVCSAQYACPAVHNIPDSGDKRRWSSPLLPIQSAGRLCYFPHQLRLQSQQHSVPPSAAEPVTSYTSNNRWYIPPPSRRLLSQPLPPLPSVGPSGAESMAGTIDSSHASSSLTPEDEDDAASLHSVNSVPDFTCLARSSAHQTSKSSHRCVREPQRLHVPPTHHTPLSSPNMSWHIPQYVSRRRHSSLGSLDDHYQTPHPVPADPLVDEYWCSKELPFRESSLISNAQTYCVNAPATTTPTVTHSEYTLVSEDDGSHVVAHSRDTSTTHVGFPSDLSLPCSEVADYDVIPWQSRLSPPSWPEDVGLTKSVNHAAARRSVSCVTDTKLFTGRLQSLDPRVVATLPARRECDLPSQTQTASDAVVFPITTEMVLSTGATTSLSSNSSRTATSSGVALTAGSFSSRSTPPFGSAGTTRPSSSAISWPPPPPTLIEEHEAFEVEGGENCRSTDDRIGAAELCVSANESKQQERNAPNELKEPLGSDTTPLPRSCPIRPPLKRANTATGSGGDDAKVPANVPTSGGLNYSPNNASLILVATQLEEVQHGATKLRSRHQTLSFRLSNRLAREHRISVTSTTDLALKSHSKPEDRTEASSHDPDPVENDTETTQEQTSVVDVEEQEGEEATASLCARLAAIEMLIEQAESMEARLRDEINHYMSSSSAGSASVTRRIDSSAPQHQFCNGCRQEVVCQSETTFSGYGSRTRGRYRRSDSNFSQYAYKSTLEPHLLPRGRGRGRGRNRRGRHAGGGFTNGGTRSRGPMWPNKPVSSPGSCAVALSPAV